MVNAERIIAYESGELPERALHPKHDSIIKLFADLIKDGSAWTLQGSYGRLAAAYIEAGMISKDGQILELPE